MTILVTLQAQLIVGGLRLDNGKYPTLSLFLKQHSRQFRAKSGC